MKTELIKEFITKKHLVAFTLILTLLSAPFYYVLLGKEGEFRTLVSTVGYLMWMVSLAGFFTIFLFKLDWKMLGVFKLEPVGNYVMAFAIPTLACIIVYGFVWALHIGTIDFSKLTNDNVLMRFFTLLTLGTLMTMKIVLGEEIGWRGVFTPICLKYFNGSIFKTTLLIGIIWALWHSPLIISGQYSSGNSAWITLPAFIFNVLAVTLIMTMLRIRGQSFWAAAILHSVHNVLVQGFFDVITVDTSGYASYITTEFGFGLGIVYFVFAYFIYTKLMREPCSSCLPSAHKY